MDRNNRINEHSKEKLRIYKNYLEVYVAIMNRVNSFKEIQVIEPFAGKGISDNGEKGSAIIAKEVLNNMKNKGADKFKLIFNDKTFFKELESNLLPDDKISIFNLDAETFINRIISSNNRFNCVHQLFFIDPWGYSQVKGVTYDKLFGLSSFELLVFIPVSQIFRFLASGEGETQLKPIATFLLDMGISDVKSCKNIDDFTDKMIEAFKTKAKTEFVYCKKLKNLHANSQHSLFFITKNILGAEKFLEALSKNEGLNLFEDVDVSNDKKLQRALFQRSLTNIELYKLIIKSGYLPKNLRPYLEKLEDKGILTVEPKDGKTRRRHTYCLEYNSNRRIVLKFQ